MNDRPKNTKIREVRHDSTIRKGFTVANRPQAPQNRKQISLASCDLNDPQVWPPAGVDYATQGSMSFNTFWRVAYRHDGLPEKHGTGQNERKQRGGPSALRKKRVEDRSWPRTKSELWSFSPLVVACDRHLPRAASCIYSVLSICIYFIAQYVRRSQESPA